MHACLSLSFSYRMYLYFVLSSITKKGEIVAHLGRGVLIWSRRWPRPRVVPMPLEGSTEGKVQGKYGELAAQWLEQCRAHLALRRRFPTVVPQRRGWA